MSSHIGIDFGTTKTLVSILNRETGIPELVHLGRGSAILPTTAYFHADGHVDFGDDADDMIEEQDGTYIRRFKMELGHPTALHMYIDQGQIHQVYAIELVQQFLQYIRTRVQNEVFLGEPVTHATITRPVNFSPAQCEALKQAAMEAGFEHVDFTTEPEAAGLAFCRRNAAQAFRKSALIVDWGGGTLDLALVTREGNDIKIHRNLVAGDMEIGGEKFDEVLWNLAAAYLHQHGVADVNRTSQLPKVRRAKEQLSNKDSIVLRLSHGGGISSITLSRDEFNQLIHDYVGKACGIVQALLARIPAEDKPEMLILVGGSSSIPLIKEKLEATCGLTAHKWHYSREAVALGAALWNNHIEEVKESPCDQAKESNEADIEEARESLYDQAQKFYEAKEYEKAIPLLRQAAEQGHAGAQCLLGFTYLYGWAGVTVNLVEAVKWFRQAAVQGNAKAQWMLGDCYWRGNGVARDTAEAFKWYHKAANQGDAEAQCLLGKCYFNGTGVAQNLAEAVKWFHKAAEQGYAEAQCNLGACLFNGWGTVGNQAEAVHWFRQAAEQGYTNAQVLIGECYHNGRGEKQSYVEALGWFRKAAEQNNADAQTWVGQYYLNGWSVQQNLKNADYWFRKAATQGHELAQEKLNELQQMQPGAQQAPAPSPLSSSTTEGNTPAPQTSKTSSKSWSIYFFLALGCGWIGIHNFYAGRYKIATIQLGLIGISQGFLIPLTFIWAIYEAFTVKKDGDGNALREAPQD